MIERSILFVFALSNRYVCIEVQYSSFFAPYLDLDCLTTSNLAQPLLQYSRGTHCRRISAQCSPKCLLFCGSERHQGRRRRRGRPRPPCQSTIDTALFLHRSHASATSLPPSSQTALLILPSSTARGLSPLFAEVCACPVVTGTMSAPAIPFARCCRLAVWQAGRRRRWHARRLIVEVHEAVQEIRRQAGSLRTSRSYLKCLHYGSHAIFTI